MDRRQFIKSTTLTAAALAATPRFAFATERAFKDRKSTRLNSSHSDRSRMPSSA